MVNCCVKNCKILKNSIDMKTVTVVYEFENFVYGGYDV